MQVTMDITTYWKAKDAIEFAIDECSNRALEAHALGETRTNKAWMLIRAEYIKTLEEFDRLPMKRD